MGKIKHNEFVNKKRKKTLDYIDHLLAVAFTFTSCLSVYSFASIDDISVEITSSAVVLKSNNKITIHKK